MKSIEINKTERAFLTSLKSAQTRSIQNAFVQESLSISKACKFVSLESAEVKERDETGALHSYKINPRAEFISRLELSRIEINPLFTSDDVYKIYKIYGKFTRNFKGVEIPILKFGMNNIVSAYESQAREIAKALKLQAKEKAKK